MSFTLKNYDCLAQLNGFLSDEEISLIQQYAANLHAEEGRIGTSEDIKVPKLDVDYRNSIIKWIDPHPDVEWLWAKIFNMIEEVNSKFFHLDLDGCSSFQHTTYNAPSGRYRPHIDNAGHNYPHRKMSFSIQLTDPSEYEGGDVLVYYNNLDKPIRAPREKGSIIVFLSMHLHEVTEVTSGTRQSLVGWVMGPPFK